MTSSDNNTRLERALDTAHDDYERFCLDHPHQDVDAAVDAIDDAIGRILAAPLSTFGDVRLRARALVYWYDGNYSGEHDGLQQLLEALEQLPPRLWAEKIGAG